MANCHTYTLCMELWFICADGISFGNPDFPDVTMHTNVTLCRQIESLECTPRVHLLHPLSVCALIVSREHGQMSQTSS